MKFLVIILLFASCISTKQSRFLDSTIITRDSISVHVDSITGDTVRYKKRIVHISHTPTWQNKYGFWVVIAAGVVAVLGVVVKFK